MNLFRRLIFFQLLLINLISLIYEGQSVTPSAAVIGLSSSALVLILLNFTSDYASLDSSFQNMIAVGMLIVQMELYILNLGCTTNLRSEIHKGSALFRALCHICELYFMLRLCIQSGSSVEQIIVAVLLQPVNQYLITIMDVGVQKTPPKEVQASPRVASQTLRQMEMPLLSQNLSFTEEIFNCLPYGIILIDKNFKIIKQNDKLMHYLQIEDMANSMKTLNQLLSTAELNHFMKSPKHPFKKNPSNTTQPRHYSIQKGVKQNSVNLNTKHQQSSFSKLQWLSGKYSMKEQSVEAHQYQFIRCVIEDFIIKNQKDQSQTFNSEMMQVFKFHVTQNLEEKKRHLSIKVYQIDNMYPTGSAISEPLYLFVIENITNKEELKSLTHRYQFQQALLNSFSHELRTPMNCTLSLLQALQQRVTQQLNTEFLQPAIVSGKKLLYQINGILDFGQIECKDFSLNLTLFKQSQVFDVVKLLFEAECHQKDIQFILDVDENIMIKSDKDRLTLILINLVDNSIKFTKQGGRIIVSCKRRDNQLIFTVWDNGKGFSEQQIVQAQSGEFTRSQPENSANKLGLGLKITTSILRYLSHERDLRIKSQENIYTSVQFAIEDIHPVSNEDVIQRVYDSPVKLKNKLCSCAQVLIVDDVPFNHIAMKAIIQNFKLKTESAYDGQQAITMVQGKLKSSCCKVFKLIFMDIEMPGKNGFQTSLEIAQLLKTRQLFDQCIIIMCSAYSGEENVEQAHASGMTEIIPKPINLPALKVIIDKYI